MFFQRPIAHAIDFEPASVRRASFVPFFGARRLRISVSLHVYHAELNATVDHFGMRPWTEYSRSSTFWDEGLH